LAFWVTTTRAPLKTTAKEYARQQAVRQNKANQLRARARDLLGSAQKQQKPKQNKRRVMTGNKTQNNKLHGVERGEQEKLTNNVTDVNGKRANTWRTK